MAYIGERLLFCPARGIDFSRVEAVLVSGDKWNPCGHMLLKMKGGLQWYVQATTDGLKIRAYPTYMDEEGYQQYLSENHKQELARYPLHLSAPDDAVLKFEQLLADQWTWKIFWHNCSTFVTQIVRAGGGDVTFNACPSHDAHFKSNTAVAR